MNFHTLHLFEGYGIELEYMIVKSDTLDVYPAADMLLDALDEANAGDDMLSWSNELVLHVIELKTGGAVPSLEMLPAAFGRSVRRINEILQPRGGRLMPTAMHPWMDPLKETRLWPHGSGEVYQAFNKIFDCRGHGWANIQSMHINLPFNGDDEFRRLHAAVRLALPLIPAIAASSPLVEGRVSAFKDARLDFYRNNQRRIPSITGMIIPEPVFTRDEYEQVINQKIYADIAPHDPDGILREEWLNSRGAIARFTRNAIEIRIIDMQECPEADMIAAAAVIALIRALADERWISCEEQAQWDTADLAAVLSSTILDAEDAVIRNTNYPAAFGMPPAECAAGDLWRHIAGRLSSWQADSAYLPGGFDEMLRRGTLSRRILGALGGRPDPERVRAVYAELCDCLDEGRFFRGL